MKNTSKNGYGSAALVLIKLLFSGNTSASYQFARAENAWAWFSKEIFSIVFSIVATVELSEKQRYVELYQPCVIPAFSVMATVQ